MPWIDGVKVDHSIDRYIIEIETSISGCAQHYSISSLQLEHYSITALQHYIITALKHYLLPLLLVRVAKDTFLHGQFTALERKAYYYFTIYYFFYFPRVSLSPDGVQIF
jgi:hypothetical protein